MSFRLLTAALVFVLAADVVFAVVNTVSTYTGGALDLLWMTSYVLWGSAALHPSIASMSSAPPEVLRRLTWRRVLSIVGATQVIPAVLVFDGITNPEQIDWPAISVTTVLLFALVGARLAGLISQVQDQADQLSQQAHFDALTGLPNRRAWDQQLTRGMSRARHTGQALVVGLIDLDRFKRFNDTYGHQAGDRLLKESAAAWRGQLRSADLLARYGGEEFALMFTGSTLDRAKGFAERLLANTPQGQTFSAGLARWDGQESAEALLTRADQALYRAKNAGRNQVALDTTAPVPPPRPPLTRLDQGMRATPGQ